MELDDLSKRNGRVTDYLRLLCDVLEKEYQEIYTFGLTHGTEKYDENIRKVAVYEMISHYPFEALSLNGLFEIKNDFDFYGKDLIDGLTLFDLDIRKRMKALENQ